MTTKIADQPPPQQQLDLPPCWELVITDLVEHKKALREQHPTMTAASTSLIDMVLADMAERDRIGFERYKVRLTAHNGRDQLVDAYQEALDCAVYLRANMEEVDGERKAFASSLYELAMALVFAIKTQILQREAPPAVMPEGSGGTGQ